MNYCSIRVKQLGIHGNRVSCLRLRSEPLSGWSSNRSSTRLSASPPRSSAREENLFTACSRGTLGNRFFFVASTSLRQGCDVEKRVIFFVTNTLLTEELSPQAIYEPLRHGKDSS